MENEDRWKYAKVDINLIDEVEINANEMSGGRLRPTNRQHC